MKLFYAYLRLIRWPNLLFIALTQWLFYYCVFTSLYKETTYRTLPHPDHLFYLLMCASVLIAAAGYVINDYFDFQIDSINKPEKVLIDRIVKRRWAILWHFLLSFSGLLISLYISYKTRKWVIVAANGGCILLLYFYSTTFKKKLLSGNLIIAALTAWVIVVVYFFAGATILNYKGWMTEIYPFNIKKFYKLTILYAGFAFIVSLIREVVKDIEDINGDAKHDCKTMPVEWGIPASKVFIAVWIIVCVAALIVLLLYAWLSGSWLISIYGLIAVICPLSVILKRLYSANLPVEYHGISSMIKFVMLAGILSMIFFKFYI